MKKMRIPECVKLQDRAALAIYEITKNMTREEELAYWAEQTAALRREQEAARARLRQKATPQ